MADLTDAELPGYATIHCRTEIAAFHKKHVVRLLELAKDSRAGEIRDSNREWYNLGPGVIDPIVDAINVS